MSFRPTPARAARELGPAEGVRVERRTNRSTDPLVALSRMLESARTKSGLPVLAIADPSGLLVAGAGAFPDCEELAAHAPLLLGEPANDTLPVPYDLFRSSEVELVHLDGGEVLVCGVGEPSSWERALPDVVAGCERILGPSRARR
jgi:hypothetical protein